MMNLRKQQSVVIGFVCLFLLLWCSITLAAKKVIHVWHTETNPLTRKAMANIVARFEALHPDIKVEAEALAWGDLEGKILAALAAGAPPELSHGQPITCTALQAKGLLLPLDAVVAAIGEENIWEQIKKVCRVGEHYYGLVHAAGTSLLIYRKDLASQKDLRASKTWDDLLHNAKQLTMDTNGDGTIDIYGLTLPGDNLFVNILLGELTKANGGSAHHDRRHRSRVWPDTIQVLWSGKDRQSDPVHLYVCPHYDRHPVLCLDQEARECQHPPGPHLGLHHFLPTLQSVAAQSLLPEHSSRTREGPLTDGADRARAVLYVILPLALPGIIATSIFTFILAWNDYIFVRILITSDELKTLPVGIADLYNATVIDWGMIMSGGMLITVPVLVFFIFVQRYLIAGWGAGALKG